MNNIPKIFLKNSILSKPSIILMVGWGMIIIWYFITDFPFMKEWPLLDIFAIPFLTLLFGYYVGKYNFSDFISESKRLWQIYMKDKK